MLIPETIAPQRVTMSASGPNSAPPEWYCHFRTQVGHFVGGRRHKLSTAEMNSMAMKMLKDR